MAYIKLFLMQDLFYKHHFHKINVLLDSSSESMIMRYHYTQGDSIPTSTMEINHDVTVIGVSCLLVLKPLRWSTNCYYHVTKVSSVPLFLWNNNSDDSLFSSLFSEWNVV